MFEIFVDLTIDERRDAFVIVSYASPSDEISFILKSHNQSLFLSKRY